ncbi:MAG: hypothetical protein K9K62_01400 [Desulfobacteraceae bacterium]|nr:hypothetical protein [Desulfobacteraceae bacterium]
MSVFRKLLLTALPVFFLFAGIMAGPAAAQEILLDQMEKCADLICYPDAKAPDRFYYLPDQPGLAYKNGRPQFSFLKYARTHETGKAGTGRARGGGIVHFLVTYGVSRDRVRQAEKDLQQRHPEASLVGPVAYRKGSFALITSFQQGQDRTTRTVAVGKAPLMEGQKAAVSMALTREGAELLWESFQSDTPDISLVFDMEFAGIREPYEATLEADWKRVSKHDSLKAGFKYAWFGADVDLLFQELRQTGAVKITTKGENANMDKILQSANEKLLKVMFDPAPADALARASEDKDSYGSLNQAVKLLKNAAGAKDSGSGKKTSKKNAGVDSNIWNTVLSTLFPRAYAESGTLSEKTHAEITAMEEAAFEIDPGYAYNLARERYEKARKGGFKVEDTRAALETYKEYREKHNPTGSRAKEVNGRIRMLGKRLEAKTESSAVEEAIETIPSVESPEQKPEKVQSDSSSGASSKPGSSAKEKSVADADKNAGSPNPAMKKSASGPSEEAKAGNAKSKKSENKSKKATAAQKNRSNGFPGFSLVASYQMKRIKRSGKMVYHMNHYRTENQAFAMAENIGPIYRKYGNDPRVFRAVTIDDPVFKQREIRVTLDGQDAATFTRYMNFVTVKMKKRHQAGDVTTAEVVITPETFTESGNHFSMTYGWKNDADRSAWLDYQYQAIWSFHGGMQIRTPWKATDAPMLALAPPHHYRTISIEGDGSRLTGADVRHGVITVKCRIKDHYVTRQATIRNKGPAPSLVLDIPEDPDNPETRVNITWYLTENRKISSAEKKLEGDIIYWDELPGGGV